MPNYGGIWETAVKSIKKVLVNIAGDLNLTEDELRTVARQAASVVNSRPITTLSSDPNDLEPLTPGHFIYGCPPASLPEHPSLALLKAQSPMSVSQAQRMACANLQVWQRFYKEYLSSLIPRTKWLTKSNQLHIGSVVLVMEDNIPPLKWLLGRIVELQKSSDGLVRVVKIKCPKGIITRGINCVAPLPLHGGEDV
uniref:CSON007524 protein n=1 Tax=Culicoides sonorensis TaxID=179676 RepID=A0A336KES2_CULSO